MFYYSFFKGCHSLIDGLENPRSASAVECLYLYFKPKVQVPALSFLGLHRVRVAGGPAIYSAVVVHSCNKTNLV